MIDKNLVLPNSGLINVSKLMSCIDGKSAPVAMLPGFLMLT